MFLARLFSKKPISKKPISKKPISKKPISKKPRKLKNYILLLNQKKNVCRRRSRKPLEEA